VGALIGNDEELAVEPNHLLYKPGSNREKEESDQDPTIPFKGMPHDLRTSY
jgi:hypothetical protein